MVDYKAGRFYALLKFLTFKNATMANVSKVITPEIKNWLLTKAWKNKTLQEIALETNINVSMISRLFKENGIEPVSKRDRIASKVLDIYNSDRPLPNNHELSLMLNCSDALIKKIIEEYSLTSATIQYKTKSHPVKDDLTTQKLAALEDYDRRMQLQKKARASFTIYTQSSSDIIDTVRQMHTTLRPKTYLTNNE